MTKHLQATDLLLREHHVIEKVLACLEKMIDLKDDDKCLDFFAAEHCLFVLRGYVQLCHFRKGANCLCPMLKFESAPGEPGLRKMWLQQQEEARRHLNSMSDELEMALSKDPTSLERFVDAARSYIHILREAMNMEREVLFPLINMEITQDEQAVLLEMFEKESEQLPPEEYLEIARDLMNQCGVPWHQRPPSAA